jgi:hypothetical protein
MQQLYNSPCSSRGSFVSPGEQPKHQKDDGGNGKQHHHGAIPEATKIAIMVTRTTRIRNSFRTARATFLLPRRTNPSRAEVSNYRQT